MIKVFFFALFMTTTIGSVGFGQPADSCLFPCDVIPYTDSQDATCLECLVNRPKYLEKISLLELKAKELEQSNQDHKMENSKLRDDNTRLIHENDDLMRSKRMWRSIAIGSVGIIIIESIILWIK